MKPSTVFPPGLVPCSRCHFCQVDEESWVSIALVTACPSWISMMPETFWTTACGLVRWLDANDRSAKNGHAGFSGNGATQVGESMRGCAGGHCNVRIGRFLVSGWATVNLCPSNSFATTPLTMDHPAILDALDTLGKVADYEAAP